MTKYRRFILWVKWDRSPQLSIY